MHNISLLALLCCLTFSFYSSAQYTFSTTTGTYTALSNPISLNQGTVWTQNTTYPLNFNFEVYGKNFTTLEVNAGGGIQFSTSTHERLDVARSTNGGLYLNDKGTSSSQSAIGYEISGTPGNQILKVEWINAGFPQGMPWYDSTDFIDFQIWLFENDNHIEVHIGPNKFDAYSFAAGGNPNDPTLSILLKYDDCSNILGVTGAANNPSYNFFDYCSFNATSIHGSPNPGIIYNFQPAQMTSTQALQNSDVMIYPNPTQDKVYIENTSRELLTQFELFDATGKQLMTKELTKENSLIEVSLKDYPNGVYFLKVIGNDIMLNKQIIKRP